MAGNATSLSIMDLNSRDRSNLGLLHVEEVDIMSRYVNTGEDEKSVGALSVEPLRLVER